MTAATDLQRQSQTLTNATVAFEPLLQHRDECDLIDLYHQLWDLIGRLNEVSAEDFDY